LADAEHLWCPHGDVVEQGVHGGEALVAGAGVVASILFEMSEEADDALEGQVVEAKAGDL